MILIRRHQIRWKKQDGAAWVLGGRRTSWMDAIQIQGKILGTGTSTVHTIRSKGKRTLGANQLSSWQDQLTEVMINSWDEHRALFCLWTKYQGRGKGGGNGSSGRWRSILSQYTFGKKEPHSLGRAYLNVLHIRSSLFYLLQEALRA